ncbi:MAG: class I adenylate-forming enzyme family protein [Actinomycetota bacterium]|jgi:long-chain acyl-CoA synthetase|nr:class I adenylate-forming enzyme family protein [Actinomycetota bacterium]MEC8520989.1 class I adenylate-forming enzyme family protein [Actinomycetota bacterium]MEC9224364.1 class I adenylate-forming enzyme family protein [Actinomycetota bacterium]MED5329603.1 class I adenylate-forming enzyme family protein [Actinomycetota bacterium]
MSDSLVQQRLDAFARITAVGEPYELVDREDIRGPVQTFVNAPTSLRQVYEDAASDVEFVVAEDQRWTFAEFWNDAATIGHLLVHDLGVRKGDRVAISMRNYPEWMLAFAAATSVGAIAVAMNSLWNADEMAYGLTDSGAKVLFADAERLALVESMAEPIEGLQVVAVRHTGSPAADVELAVRMAEIGSVPMPEVDIAPTDSALILYTSGSTGHPKGVLSNHHNVIVALMAWEVEYGALTERPGNVVAPKEGSGLVPASLLGIPLFHVLGLHAVFLASFRGQRKLVAMYKWDASVAAELIERERIVTFTGPPAVSGDLVRVAQSEGRDLSSLLSVGGGGAARPPEQVGQIDDTFEKALPNTGWGMTETNAIGTLILGAEYSERRLSSGPALCVIDLRVVDDDGNELQSGERGELQVRGPSMFREYWNKPEATADSFAEDGWFKTGDVAYIDTDGHLFIVDRIKDLIIRGGENIGCGGVEAALSSHPKVIEAAVYSVPDDRLGEEVGTTMYVTEDFDETELREYLVDHLAKYEIPRYVTTMTEPLPRTGSGKLLKRQLRDDTITELGLG